MKTILLILTLTIFITISATAETWVKVECGTDHSLALTSEGRLFSCGDNEFGQLGTGPEDTEMESLVEIVLDKKWKTMSAGDFHCLAVDEDGYLWAWGENLMGEVGDGTTTLRYTPVRIGNDHDWKFVSAGWSVSYAIKEDGSLWSWGYNDDGELGNGTNIERHTPGKVGNDNDWEMVDAGGFHALALKTDATLWVWGANASGQLGNGTTLEAFEPEMIGNKGEWKYIAAGPEFAFGIKKDNSLWGWGINYYGQLGDGTFESKSLPSKTGGSGNWMAVAAATGYLDEDTGIVFGDFTLAVKEPANVICASGDNFFGQLGDGTIDDKYVFTCNTGDLGTGVEQNVNNTNISIYPNPFPVSTTINYSLDKPEYVIIKVYNSLGNEIETLVNNFQTSGKYEVEFNAEGLAPCVYYYTMLIGRKVESGKLVLIR